MPWTPTARTGHSRSGLTADTDEDGAEDYENEGKDRGYDASVLIIINFIKILTKQAQHFASLLHLV